MIGIRKYISSLLLLTTLAVLFLTQVSVNAQDTRDESLPSLAVSRLEYDAEQLACLARNIYYEARGESFEGKVAVAQVTVNRANSPRFPDDICGVVYQRVRGFCQFSWVCNKSTRPMRDAAYQESLRIAEMVLIEGHRLPQIRGALYFHNTSTNPGWNLTRLARIGQHIFYR